MGEAMDIGPHLFEQSSVRDIGNHLIRRVQIDAGFDLLGAIRRFYAARAVFLSAQSYFIIRFSFSCAAVSLCQPSQTKDRDAATSTVAK
jgi:hypothetical protein